MEQVSQFWLAVALVLYFPGLVHTLWNLLTHRIRFQRLAQTTFTLGVILEIVWVVDFARLTQRVPTEQVGGTIVLFGLVVALAYLLVSRIYQFETLGLFVYPVVFLTTLVGIVYGRTTKPSAVSFMDAWLFLHVVFILLGFSALFLTFGSSILYLVQEWRLKKKKFDRALRPLPPLMVIDKVISRSMILGFVFVTIGMAAAIVWASGSGQEWWSDPRIHISLLTWFTYLAMVALKQSAGWRGRKAAWMVLCVVSFSAITWVTHAGLGDLVQR